MELNEKLARWAGFHFQTLDELHPKYRHEANLCWVYSTIWIGRDLPDFITSLDACFQWLVPKLQDAGYMVDLTAHEHKGFYAKLSSIFQSAREPEEYYEPIADAKDDSAALALCKVIKQLIIDKENNDKP